MCMTKLKQKDVSDHYQQMVDSAPLLLCSFRPDTTLTLVNQAYCDYFGKRREELIGTSFLRFIPPEEQMAMQRHLASFSLRRTAVTYEHKVVTATNKIVWQRWTDRAIFDDHGQVTEFYSVGIDITAEKEMALALKQRNDEFEFIMDMGPAMVYTCKASGDFTPQFVSNNVRSLFGYEPQEFLQGKQFWQTYMHPDDTERVMNNLHQLFSKGRHVHEYRFLHKNGEYRWVRDELRLIRDQEGQPSEIIGIWIDTTDQRQAKEKQEEAENTYSLIAQASSDGICQFDEHATFSYVNETCATLFGYDYKEIVGKQLRDIVHEDYQTQIEQFSQRIQAGDTALGSFVMRHKFGHHVPVFVHVIPVIKFGKIERMIGVVKDLSSTWESEQLLRQQISKIHALEQRVKQLNEQLAQAQMPDEG